MRLCFGQFALNTTLTFGFMMMTLAPGFVTGQTISTYAGTGTCCADADGVAATSAHLQGADGLTFDRLGNLYIWESQPFRVRMVNTAGIISTVAGIYQNFGSTGDGGPATSALLHGGSLQAGLAMDAAGNLFISDGGNQRIRKVDTAGIITTVAGNGTTGFSGDGGSAINAQLADPNGIAVDSAGNLYIADSSNMRIRMVTPAGIITTVAGNGNVTFSGDGGQAVNAGVDRPVGVTVDSNGNLYISGGRRVRKVNTQGIISTAAGNGSQGFSGDGGPATSAEFRGPAGMAVDPAGNLYIADTSNQRIRKVDTAGIITTIAGAGLGFSGDGGPASSAQLAVPHDVVFDAAGNLYISDTGNFRIRKIAASGPLLVADPSSLTFASAAGSSSSPAAQSVNITSSGAPLSFTISASTSAPTNWLTANLSSATTPATLVVSVSPGALSAGAYPGTITLTPTGGAPQNFGVTLNIIAANTPSFSSNGVVNASGSQNKLAPDTVFVIYGNGMGPADLVSAPVPNYPASLGGTSVTFTPVAGGAAITANMVYSVAGQIAGLLPSSITPGTYAVRVTYNGQTSAPQNITVVARSLGIAAANSIGSGPVQATIGNVNGGVSLTRFTSGSVFYNGLNWTLTPAHPGDTLVLWGTGGGADPANDSGGSSGDQTAAGNFIVNVGGRKITPLFAGASSGYPGLWQVNFTLPADIDTGCAVFLQVSAGGELSNSVSLPIAPAGQTACIDPDLSAATLAKLDAGGIVTFGAFGLAKLTDTASGITQETASGFFGRYTSAAWMASNMGPRFGFCRVYDRTYPVGGIDPNSPTTRDAGPRLPLSGPNLPAGFSLGTIASPLGIFYGNSLASGTLAPGTYTLTGPGGTQIGPFSASTVFPSSFTVSNLSSVTSIDRTKAPTFDWTGSGVDQVYIGVTTNTRVGANQHIVTINCHVPGDLGTYSIPTEALAYLQPSATGALAIEAMSAPGRFGFTLVDGSGLDISAFVADLGVAKTIPVQ